MKSAEIDDFFVVPKLSESQNVKTYKLIVLKSRVEELEKLNEKLCDELTCAENVLDSLAVKFDLAQTSFECIGDYITAVVDAAIRRNV